jgi:hypothetical protein
MAAVAGSGDPGVRRLALAWSMALACGALAFVLAGLSARAVPRPHPLEELAYYPSGRCLAPATLGHAGSAADLAWLRAVQYYGEHRTSDNRFVRMAHVFDILTTLAPHFRSAYVFGAFALAQEGRDFAAGERLMMKGLSANPTDPELAFQMGFLYYVKPGGRDLARAGEYFERAARLPGAPPQATRFAAFTRQNAGELAVAYALWTDVLEHSANGYLREMAVRERDTIRAAWAARRRDLAVRHLATPRVVITSDHP